MKHFAIIVAGGVGRRVNAEIPKQFLLLDAEPVLFHTLRAFHSSRHQPKLIVVLPEDQIKVWNELCVMHDFQLIHTIVSGGKERFHSVKNGLEKVSIPSIVAVHDGARPLVSAELIDKTFDVCAEKGNAIPTISSTDSIRYVGEVIRRDKVLLIQTPQVFDSAALKTAYEQTFSDLFTDDSSVYEKSGNTLHFIEGEKRNIKITFSEDVLLAEYYLKNNAL